MSDVLPHTVMLELLADGLRDNPPPESQAKYEFRKYAERLTMALSKISIEMTSRPKVVALRTIDRRSSVPPAVGETPWLSLRGEGCG